MHARSSDRRTLSNNWLNGTLPDSWGAPGAFAQLDTLTISNQGSQFTGQALARFCLLPAR
jgi:hypothetical protein